MSQDIAPCAESCRKTSRPAQLRAENFHRLEVFSPQLHGQSVMAPPGCDGAASMGWHCQDVMAQARMRWHGHDVIAPPGCDGAGQVMPGMAGCDSPGWDRQSALCICRASSARDPVSEG